MRNPQSHRALRELFLVMFGQSGGGGRNLCISQSGITQQRVVFIFSLDAPICLRVDRDYVDFRCTHIEATIFVS